MASGDERKCLRNLSLAIVLATSIPTALTFPQQVLLPTEVARAPVRVGYVRGPSSVPLGTIAARCRAVRMAPLAHVADVEGLQPPSATPGTQMDEGEEICRRLGCISHSAVIEGKGVRVRVATPSDYMLIADLRFSVFSPYHPDLRHRFRERSYVLMSERRRLGAFCLIAVLDECPQGEDGVLSQEQVLGTLECSKHEFKGTALDPGETNTRLYLTEVAVRADYRRMGVGTFLMGLVDDVAVTLGASEVYLHVNEVNEKAVHLYEKCGYQTVADRADYRKFTASLGLSGGYIGQHHYLMRKLLGPVVGGVEGTGAAPAQAA
ncbi:unnamed protein product [Discosporangium mesarthrocarpum]